jgi:DNA invertase Pin-like site-specific DNA recombinase
MVMKQPEPAKGEFIGYARVSTKDQVLRLQTDALERVGCLNIYTETISGAAKKRPQLDLAIKDLRPGDTLVVWRLDRLARSLRDLHKRLDQIVEAGALFKSLQENFDLTTAMGRLYVDIAGAFAEFERQLTIERTRAGMAALKARGERFGMERKLDDKMRAAITKMVLDDPTVTIKQIAKKFKIATSTFNGNFKNGKRGILRAGLKKRKH